MNAYAASDAVLESNTSRRFRERGRSVSPREEDAGRGEDDEEDDDDDGLVFGSGDSGAIAANDKTRTGAA
jgi:hypothetical protein